ncbi:MAG: hypothetical protein WD768_15735 [Phycisphaeraceae bacterium]
MATLLLASLCLLAGCGPKEDVRTYTVPKPVQPTVAVTKGPGKTAAPPSGNAAAVRLLGAIIPHDNASWVFKFTGPTALVSTEYDAFVRFISSIKFQIVTDEQDRSMSLPRWTLPQGWQQQAGGNEMRFATITVGPAAHAQEITVFRFPGDVGGVMANLERWSGQIGLKNLTPAQLADMTTTITVDGQPATLVDMVGPGGGDSGMGPTHPGQPPGHPPVVDPRPPAPSTPPQIVYEVPQGWVKQELQAGTMRMAGFNMTEGDATAEMTVIPLPNQGGQSSDPVANFNRWRQQVGLEPATRETYENDMSLDASERKYLTTVRIDGGHAFFVDYTGPADKGGQRVIGVMQLVGGYIYFYKLSGPAELVGKNRDAFGAFLQSVRYQEPQ